jgi:hypothetical protein
MTDRLGKVSAVRLSPMEIQEDLQVEPEAGSYMAVDDDMKKQAAMELGQAAMAAPQVYDVQKVATFYLSTIRGLPGDPADFLNKNFGQPQPPQPKFNVNLQGKMEDQPELTKAILQEYGIDVPGELDEQAQVNTVGRISKAADAADNLLTKTGTENEPEPQSDLAQAQKTT